MCCATCTRCRSPAPSGRGTCGRTTSPTRSTTGSTGSPRRWCSGRTAARAAPRTCVLRLAQPPTGERDGDADQRDDRTEYGPLGRVAHRAAQHHAKPLEREQHAESRNDNAEYSEDDTEYRENSAHAFSLHFVNWQ